MQASLLAPRMISNTIVPRACCNARCSLNVPLPARPQLRKTCSSQRLSGAAPTRNTVAHFFKLGGQTSTGGGELRVEQSFAPSVQRDSASSAANLLFSMHACDGGSNEWVWRLLCSMWASIHCVLDQHLAPCSASSQIPS